VLLFPQQAAEQLPLLLAAVTGISLTTGKARAAGSSSNGGGSGGAAAG